MFRTVLETERCKGHKALTCLCRKYNLLKRLDRYASIQLGTAE